MHGPQYVDKDFGSRGCLETLSGLGALRAKWNPEGADSPDWVAELFRAAENGDDLARKAVDDAGTVLGIAAANVCSVLDPSLVVLGGALAQGAPLVERVRQIISSSSSRRRPSSCQDWTKMRRCGKPALATSAARERLRQRLRQQLGPDRDTALTAAGAR